MSWTDADKFQIETLLNDGMNLKEIASVIGRTHGMVCGIVWRTPFLKAANARRVSRMSHGDRYRHLFPKKAVEINVATPPLSLKPAAYDAKALKMTLMDLRPNQCRYPVSHDREHLFCGHARWNEATMYCEHHARRCVAARHV